VPSYFQSLEHLLRYCARPPFALERLSVIRGPDGRIAKVRYVLPRHKAANWVGPGRGRKTTRPGAECYWPGCPYPLSATNRVRQKKRSDKEKKVSATTRVGRSESPPLRGEVRRR